MASLIDKFFEQDRINLESIARKLQISLGESRSLAVKYGYEPIRYKHAIRKTSVSKGYLVTSYTPGVPLHQQFWEHLKFKCLNDNLMLVVVPTAPALQKEDWIDTEVQQHLNYDANWLERCLVAGHMQFSPLVARPSNGMASFGDGRSIVLASPRQITKQLPTLIGYSPATQILTTGSCNDWSQYQPRSLAQIKAHHHYRLGFVIVGESGQQMRQIHATKAGEFTDLGIDHQGVYRPVQGVVWGDLHAAQINPAAVEWATRLTSELKAPLIVGHDTFDGQTCNRHDLRASNRFSQFSTVSAEVEHHNIMLKAIEQATGSKFILPFSNHTAFLDTWCNNIVPIALCKSDLNLFTKVIQEGSQSVMYGRHLAPGGRHDIGRFNVGEHGHAGINGARGGILSHAQYGHRMVTGHTHTPESYNGAEIVGCLCELQQGYNRIGGSTWRHSIGAIDCYNKFQHLIKEFA